jgi:hypothetical protein
MSKYAAQGEHGQIWNLTILTAIQFAAMLINIAPQLAAFVGGESIMNGSCRTGRFAHSFHLTLLMRTLCPALVRRKSLAGSGLGERRHAGAAERKYTNHQTPMPHRHHAIPVSKIIRV